MYGPPPPHSHSVEPMVVGGVREIPTQPDPNELSRRHFVQQDWAARQTRERNAKSAVLAMVAALFFAGTIAVVVYRFGRPRMLGVRTATTTTVPAASMAAPPPPAASPEPAPTAIVTATATATTPPIVTAPPSARPAPAKSVHPAGSSVRSTHSSGKK